MSEVVPLKKELKPLKYYRVVVEASVYCEQLVCEESKESAREQAIGRFSETMEPLADSVYTYNITASEAAFLLKPDNDVHDTITGALPPEEEESE